MDEEEEEEEEEELFGLNHLF